MCSSTYASGRAWDPSDQVAGAVDLDLEPGLSEPARCERVGGVLLRRVADAVAEGGQLVETLQDPHAAEPTARADRPSPAPRRRGRRTAPPRGRRAGPG